MILLREMIDRRPPIYGTKPFLGALVILLKFELLV